MNGRIANFLAICLAAGMAAAPVPALAATSWQSQGQSISQWFTSSFFTWHSDSSAPPTPTPVTHRLVAFGDSVAAGYGLPAASNPGPTDAQCGRSPVAYPDLIAASRNLISTNLACSGARVGEGLLTAQEFDGSTEVKSQIAQAVGLGHPDIATLTLSANNVYWQDWLRYCAAATCGSETDTRNFEFFRAASEGELTAGILAIAALEPKRFVVTGYYDPLAGGTTCAATAGIDQSELYWLQARLGDLNRGIAQAAARIPGVTFVQPDFGSRGLCSASSLVQGLGDPGPLHPTAAGQQIIAQQVLAALR